MSKLKVEKDNVVLAIEEDCLAEYEARGYEKVGATKKVAPKDADKKIADLTKKNALIEKENTELKNKNTVLETENTELKNKNSTFEKEIEDLKKTKEELEKKLSK